MANYDPGKRPAWLTRELFPFESRFVGIRGHNIHYIDEGKGDTILFLHGNPAWSFLFRKIISRLSANFRCVALDYPGFGLSSAAPGYDFLPASHAAITAEFVEKLGLRNITLGVSDWGGPIGLTLAAENPHNIKSLIIGNTFAWPVNDDFHFIWFSRFFGGRLGRFLVRRFNLFVNALMPAGVKHAKLTSDEMAAYRLPFPDAEARMPTHIFPREILGSHAFMAHLQSNLHLIAQKPALFLWGGKDIAFRSKELSRFQSCLPNSITVNLPRAGHFIWEDEPEAISDEIRNFLFRLKR